MKRFAALWLLVTLLGTGCSGRQARPNDQPASSQAEELLPARVRRLSNVEYERAASHLLGIPVALGDRLPPDVRQEGFTRNADQTIAPAHAKQLARIAEELSAQAVDQRLGELAPCFETGSPHCRDRFIEKSARRAFRRNPTRDERVALSRVFEAGRSKGGFRGGVELTLNALLQAPSLLYVSEVGEPTTRQHVNRLTPLQTASVLAFTVSGGPPDDELLQAAERGDLETARAREYQARRLLAKHDTRLHFRRFVLEWLEVDRIEETAKNAELHPRYERTKGRMLAETEAFVDEVMVHYGASLEALLTAGFASVDPTMARYYDLDAWGPRVSLDGTGRIGLLQQASFLAAHAHEDSTSPVKRGDFVMRKLLCTTLPRPQELQIEVTIPAPDPHQTTRERFGAHVTNESCQSCHAPIDALGFTFENFDGAGRERRTENEKPISTSSDFEYEGNHERFTDSVALSRWLARNPTVHECFARHAFRYFSAQSDAAPEKSFIEVTRRLPAGLRDNVTEMLIAYVRSDLFVLRKAAT